MWYDILIGGIVLFSAIRAHRKGFVWQVAMIGTLLLCFAFAQPLSLIIAPVITIQPPANRWVAMLVVYLLFSFMAFASARNLRTWIEKQRFLEYDRHLGATFGLVKGVVFGLVLTFFTVTIFEASRPVILNSHSGHWAAIIMDRLHVIMPQELHAVLEPYIHQLDHDGLDLQHAHHDRDDDHDHPGHDHGDHSHAPAGGDEGGSSWSDPFGNSDPFTTGGGSMGGPTPNSDSELELLLSQLPAIFDSNLRALVLSALRSAAPEDRADLIARLQSGIPESMRSVAEAWAGGKPSGAATAPTTGARAQSLLKEIAGVYTDDGPAQDDLIRDVNASLAGLPNIVVERVIEDWYADLLTFGDTDPDPSTTLTSSLDTRILNQLAQARIPLASLQGSLRNRLQESATQRR